MENYCRLSLKPTNNQNGNTQSRIVTSREIPYDRPLNREIDLYVRSLSEIIRDRSNRGWTVTLLTVMTDRVSQNPASIPTLVHDPVQRLYSKLISRVVRRPRSPYVRDRLPVLVGCADLPVFKHWTGGSLPRDPNTHGGLHFHGLLAVPSDSRLKGQTVEEHFAQNDILYRGGGGIERIDVRPVRHEDIAKVTGYVFKAVRDGRIDLDAGVLVLPRAVSELAR
jgi:hypothetical protein